MKFKYISISALLVLISACGGTKKSVDNASPTGKATPAASGTTAEGQAGDVIATTLIDNRPAEEVLCQDGPKVVSAAGKDDFSSLFALVCNQGKATAFLKEMVGSAYQGQGEPNPKIFKFEVGDMYVSTLGLAHAIKAPLANPSIFADLKPHDIFASGIKEANSELVINVEGREAFPGKRAVEKVTLNYDLRNANGAAIFDRRRTEFNTYLLVENNRDITVSTEHLLDAEKNQTYHTARGLTIGIKADNGQSYLVFLTELTIKNRIDPERIKVTLNNLNKGVAKMLFKHTSQK